MIDFFAVGEKKPRINIIWFVLASVLAKQVKESAFLDMERDNSEVLRHITCEIISTS